MILGTLLGVDDQLMNGSISKVQKTNPVMDFRTIELFLHFQVILGGPEFWGTHHNSTSKNANDVSSCWREDSLGTWGMTNQERIKIGEFPSTKPHGFFCNLTLHPSLKGENDLQGGILESDESILLE